MKSARPGEKYPVSLLNGFQIVVLVPAGLSAVTQRNPTPPHFDFDFDFDFNFNFNPQGGESRRQRLRRRHKPAGTPASDGTEAQSN